MLYAITDSLLMPDNILLSGVEAVLQGGCDYIQYRDKIHSSEQRLRDATKLLALCNSYKAKLIINDDVQLAKQIKAQGVHLGQEDGDVKAARALLGADAIIGVTCHDSLSLAQQAIDDGASYIAFGRFFSSNTKPNARPASLGLLTAARKMFPQTTIVAIGGININNAKSVLAAGADMVAVCNDLFAATDVKAQAKSFNAP